MFSDALIRQAFVQSPEAIAITRASDGVIIDVNAEWTQITGFARDEVLGRTALEIGHWPSQDAREALLEPLRLHGRVRDLDVSLVMRDGVQRLVRVNANLVEFVGGPFVLMYLRDVTLENQAQVALRTSERELSLANEALNRQVDLYEATEEVARVGHWVIYPGDPNAHFSRGYVHIVGSPDQQTLPVGTRHIDWILEEDRDLFREARKRMDGQTLEYRWHHPDGGIRWVRSQMHRQVENGVVKADYGIIQDTTPEKNALQALQERLAFVQKITGRAPGMVYELQIWANGRMRFPFVSAGVRQILGLTEENLMEDASRLFARFEPEDLLRLRAVTLEATRTLSTMQCEVRTKPIDGDYRWLLGYAIPEAQADGSLLWCGSITDITSQKRALEQLQASEMRFRSLTNLSSDWYWETDAQFRVTRVDGNLSAVDYLPISDYIGKTQWEAHPEGATTHAWALHKEQLEDREIFHDFEIQFAGTDGRVMAVSLSGAPIFDAQGSFQGYRGTGRDISAKKQAEKDIERLAFYDALTGLPNRRLLIDRLGQALQLSARRSTHGALLFIDLDNFKMLNDTLGHHMGDELLKQVALRLTHCVRSVDTVARLGGDEFVVMLEDIGSSVQEAAAQTEAVGKKVLSALNQTYELQNAHHHSSPSIGITLFFQHQHSVDALLQRADLAMYQAKSAGRNTMRFFDPEMQAVASARASLEADLRHGLARHEFMLYYQPVVDAASHITGVEALLRWKHPTRGMVSPAEFIPVAEQTGLILGLGRWVLEKACAQLVAWSAQPSTQKLNIAVNVSARQFRQPEFTEDLLQILRLSGANPYRLKLELTESLLLNEMDDAIDKMSELRSIGVSFSLDDFGTGYSSLAYLKRLPLDILKIDQSFVRDVLTDPNDAAIARTILNLAQNLDLNVVAEGVETAGQRDFLLRSGCKAFQGYLFGRPVPVAELKLP